ncbi:hypothetical protein PR202_ga07224 [Eleusine coracana subsp. coracana]|uniref:Protein DETOXIFICATION n=1 Tax=Eleusine coracana subsp. coracana TaxID=191504 RepID=A0AAV5BX12_ELECO|nr:hypothetical protein PR202_ga07224 [Eleusine coracana subsp. coracana]
MNSVQVVSLMFVGRLGRLELAGASVATAFTTATGLCVLGGMASALATLCGQAFGAGQYGQVGVHKQRAMLVLAAAGVPVAAAWAYAGELLAWCGMGADIPSLFAIAQMQCHIQFLQTQNIVVPVMAAASCAGCWRAGSGSAAEASRSASPSLTWSTSPSWRSTSGSRRHARAPGWDSPARRSKASPGS